MRPGSLLRWYDAVRERAWELNLDWIAKIARPEETSEAEGPEQRRRITTSWRLVLRPTTDAQQIKADKSDLWSAGYIVALNPALMQYDKELGFQLLPGATPAPESPKRPPTAGRDECGPIRHETYAEHIAGLYQFYVHHQRERTAAARRRKTYVPILCVSLIFLHVAADLACGQKRIFTQLIDRGERAASHGASAPVG